MVLWLGASLAMATGVDTYLVTSTRAGKFTNVQYRLYIRCSGCTQPLQVQGLASLPMYNTGYIYIRCSGCTQPLQQYLSMIFT